MVLNFNASFHILISYIIFIGLNSFTLYFVCSFFFFEKLITFKFDWFIDLFILSFLAISRWNDPYIIYTFVFQKAGWNQSLHALHWEYGSFGFLTVLHIQKKLAHHLHLLYLIWSIKSVCCRLCLLSFLHGEIGPEHLLYFEHSFIEIFDVFPEHNWIKLH